MQLPSRHRQLLSTMIAWSLQKLEEISVKGGSEQGGGCRIQLEPETAMNSRRWKQARSWRCWRAFADDTSVEYSLINSFSSNSAMPNPDVDDEMKCPNLLRFRYQYCSTSALSSPFLRDVDGRSAVSSITPVSLQAWQSIDQLSCGTTMSCMIGETQVKDDPEACPDLFQIS